MSVIRTVWCVKNSVTIVASGGRVHMVAPSHLPAFGPEGITPPPVQVVPPARVRTRLGRISPEASAPRQLLLLGSIPPVQTRSSSLLMVRISATTRLPVSILFAIGF